MPFKEGQQILGQWAEGEWFNGTIEQVKPVRSGYAQQYEVKFDDGDTMICNSQELRCLIVFFSWKYVFFFNPFFPVTSLPIFMLTGLVSASAQREATGHRTEAGVEPYRSTTRQDQFVRSAGIQLGRNVAIAAADRITSMNRTNAPPSVSQVPVSSPAPALPVTPATPAPAAVPQITPE